MWLGGHILRYVTRFGSPDTGPLFPVYGEAWVASQEVLSGMYAFAANMGDFTAFKLNLPCLELFHS